MATDNHMPHRRRSALITGGTRNIGRAVALALASDGVTCTVVSRRRDDDALVTLAALDACGLPGIHIAADVTDPDQVKKMFAEAARQFGGVDVLVHCAAIRRVAALADITLADWRDVMATNLDAAFLCSQAALGHFAPTGGRIIYISGISSYYGVADRAHVITSKAGLIGLARALATELAHLNVTVNCVSPGIIDTKRGNEARIPHSDHQARIPVGRLGKPEEVAEAVRMLASEKAAYITGQVIHVNGGVYYG